MTPLTILELTESLTKLACDLGEKKFEPQQSFPAKATDTDMLISAAADLIKQQHKDLTIYRQSTLQLIREQRRSDRALKQIPKAIDAIKAGRTDNVVPIRGV